MRVIDYCKYGEGTHTHKARKRTCIWTNTSWEPARPLCRKDCGYCVDGKHIDYAQRGSTDGRPKHTLEELYAIPQALPRELCDFMALEASQRAQATTRETVMATGSSQSADACGRLEPVSES